MRLLRINLDVRENIVRSEEKLLLLSSDPIQQQNDRIGGIPAAPHETF
jgi:hypothetical protein